MPPHHLPLFHPSINPPPQTPPNQNGTIAGWISNCLLLALLSLHSTLGPTPLSQQLSCPSCTEHQIIPIRNTQTSPPLKHITKWLQGVKNKTNHFAVIDKQTGQLMNYSQLIRHPAYHSDWTLSSTNEFRRLANRVGCKIKGANTVKFLKKSAIPVYLHNTTRKERTRPHALHSWGQLH